MTHNLGRVVFVGTTITKDDPLDFTPGAGPLGPPRFVLLRFDNVNLPPGSKLTVELGYGTDVFTGDSGGSFWSRPANPQPGPIRIRVTGPGGARLQQAGIGEASIPGGQTPGTSVGSRTNPDVFLNDASYAEPIYETRLECNPDFAWRNAACSLAPVVPDLVRERVAAVTGIIVEVHDGHVSSCSGALIGADLFLTARHCLTDPNREDQRSASVSFDYQTACDGTRPPGHVTRFFKVIEEVASGSPPTGGQPPVSTDWVVLRLDAAPGALPAPAPLRPTALMAGETIMTMHHPNGAAKKTDARVHSGGFSIQGFDYAGGSSGSALFDVNGAVVGGPLSSGSGCFVSYAPVAAIRQALTTPPAPPNPLDVMVVFDRSGSMASPAPPVGRSKLDEAQDAAALFVQLVREGQGDRLGLVTFDHVATVGAGMAPVATAKPDLVGPAPFITGKVGAIAPGGATSIGAGLGLAQLAFGSSGNDKAMLLLSDGLQNTDPTVQEIEPHLGATKLNVIGFGSDDQIDGPLLSRVAREHGGHFTRALDGLALRKFFGLSFGDIFESGALTDPEFVLGASQKQSAPHRFDVCGEERITVILGWDDVNAPLQAHIRTPSGKLITSGRRVQPVRGRSWVFWRIPLPYEGERDGTWELVVDRVPIGGEFPPPAGSVRYFFLVVCAGGPKLAALAPKRRVYTGDVVNPLVALHYPNRTTPHDAQVTLTIDAPGVALGQLTTQAGLRSPITAGDAVDAFHATLQAVAREAGGVLPVMTSTRQVTLYDDGDHDDGAIEPDGIFNNPLKDLTRAEGTYHFRAVATYGDACRASREAHWSIHVEPAIDPGRTDVKVLDVAPHPDGRTGVLVITPQDPYGNPIGPGRGDIFGVFPLPGVTVGPVKDRGDGSYEVVIVWPAGATPGVVVQQPDRDPVVLTPTGGGIPQPGGADCTEAAEGLLECMGLSDPEVKRVRVKSVSVQIDLDDCGCDPPQPKRPKDCGC